MRRSGYDVRRDVWILEGTLKIAGETRNKKNGQFERTRKGEGEKATKPKTGETTTDKYYFLLCASAFAILTKKKTKKTALKKRAKIAEALF